MPNQRVIDSGRVELIGIGKPIRVVDSPVFARLVDPTTQLTAFIIEKFRFAETGQIELVRDEAIKIRDFVTAIRSQEMNLRVSLFESI